MKSNFDRLHINYQRGLSFEDMKEIIPAVETSHGVYNDITKITLLVNLYNPKVITEIFFDESKSRFVFDNSYDERLSVILGNMYKQRMVNLGSIMELDDKYTYNDMISSLTKELQDTFN